MIKQIVRILLIATILANVIINVEQYFDIKNLYEDPTVPYTLELLEGDMELLRAEVEMLESFINSNTKLIELFGAELAALNNLVSSNAFMIFENSNEIAKLERKIKEE